MEVNVLLISDEDSKTPKVELGTAEERRWKPTMVDKLLRIAHETEGKLIEKTKRDKQARLPQLNS